VASLYRRVFTGESLQSSLQLAEKLPVIIEALTELGLEVKIDCQAERFARLEVKGLDDVTEVDFGIDYRLFPLQDSVHSDNFCNHGVPFSWLDLDRLSRKAPDL
jgi:hypothetical protein